MMNKTLFQVQHQQSRGSLSNHPFLTNPFQLCAKSDDAPSTSPIKPSSLSFRVIRTSGIIAQTSQKNCLEFSNLLQGERGQNKFKSLSGVQRRGKIHLPPTALILIGTPFFGSFGALVNWDHSMPGAALPIPKASRRSMLNSTPSRSKLLSRMPKLRYLTLLFMSFKLRWGV